MLPFPCFRLPCLPLPVPCLFPPVKQSPSALPAMRRLFPRVPVSVPVFCADCFPVSVPACSPWKIPPSGLKIPLKIAWMGTKNACFAVYRSENRSKKPVNRQTQKDSHKIFCSGCTNKSKRLTIFKNQNFYIPQMDFCKFHDAKNANPAKNAGAILALPTGQGTNPNPDGRNTAQHDRRKGW